MENSKWPPFFGETKIFKNWDDYCVDIPYGSKILSKSLYLARFSRYKHFCVLQILRKIQKFKMAAIFGETKIFFKIGMATVQTYSVAQNFVEIALCSTVFEIYAFLCFVISAKNSKIQNGRQFWRDKNFFTTGMDSLQRYPVGQKFRRNRSISHCFRDISIFVFCNFCEKFENSKWLLFFFFFLKIGMATLQIPCGSKISSKSLYVARFLRYQHFRVLQFLRKIQNGRHFW